MLKFKQGMQSTAFCPAHITGFFKANVSESEPERMGSLGAGFSIRDGVVTTVHARPSQISHTSITTSGYAGDVRVSESVAKDILQLCARRYHVQIHHEFTVPVGYGLGASGAAALSLAIAMNKALGLGQKQSEVGRLAHIAEVRCRTGLGDVIAAYHGGFEIRTEAGAPGVGILKKAPLKSRVVLIGFSPISTRRFITEQLDTINGIGGGMVNRLIKTWSSDDFQEMSLEFARHINVMTPRMSMVAERLRQNGIGCGVALFGETLFALVDHIKEQRIMEIMSEYKDAIILRSQVDNLGARLQERAGR